LALELVKLAVVGMALANPSTITSNLVKVMIMDTLVMAPITITNLGKEVMGPLNTEPTTNVRFHVVTMDTVPMTMASDIRRQRRNNKKNCLRHVLRPP
jgi:hypothetical protein